MVIAGFGSVLRGDDGVAMAVLDALSDTAVPPGVELLAVGTGGIHLVQRLFDPVDVLVVVDAVDADRPPGTVLAMRVQVPDPLALDALDRRDQAADMHLANPDRALAVARGLGVLPAQVWAVGVQPADPTAWGVGLTDEVGGAVVVAADEVRRLVADAGVCWPAR